MVDETSSDGTVEKLAALGVPVMHSGGVHGVTHNWNLVGHRPNPLPAASSYRRRRSPCQCARKERRVHAAAIRILILS